MLYLLVNDLLVAVDAEVVAVGHDVGLRHAEALLRTCPTEFGAGALLPVRQYVGQVVLGMLVLGERLRRGSAQLRSGQQLGPPVIQAVAVGVEVVVPNAVRPTAIGL